MSPGFKARLDEIWSSLGWWKASLARVGLDEF